MLLCVGPLLGGWSPEGRRHRSVSLGMPRVPYRFVQLLPRSGVGHVCMSTCTCLRADGSLR